MNINAAIISALSGIVNGNCWAIGKPVTADPDEYIVFNPENEYLDYGDNQDTADIETSMQVHWFGRGQVNYRAKRKAVRDALRGAGFILESSPFVEYQTENPTGVKSSGTVWTHFCVVCRAEGE